jgi:hypothetical protein
VPEVQVKGRVRSDEAACLRERDAGLPEQHEALVLAEDPERVGVVAWFHRLR